MVKVISNDELKGRDKFKKTFNIRVNVCSSLKYLKTTRLKPFKALCSFENVKFRQGNTESIHHLLHSPIFLEYRSDKKTTLAILKTLFNP